MKSRNLIFVAVFLYSAILLLAALRKEVRPQWIDAPARAARKGLSLFWPAGVSVFYLENDAAFWDGIFCLKAVGLDQDNQATDLNTYDHGCPPKNFKFRWFESIRETVYHRAIRSYMVNLNGHNVLREKTFSTQLDNQAHGRRIVATMGNHFCSLPKKYRTVTFLWTVQRLERESRRELTAPITAFKSDCLAKTTVSDLRWNYQTLEDPELRAQFPELWTVRPSAGSHGAESPAAQ